MSAPAPLRHVDPGLYLQHFAGEVLVRCVRCASPGTVTADPANRTARFRCGQCALALDSANGDWAGTVQLQGRRPCGYCGHRWLTAVRHGARRVHAQTEEIPAQCSECGNISAVPVQRLRSHCRAGDPHFGLPLRLIEPCRHGLLWAYNLHHLREMQAYVGAQLRERRGGGNGALFSRLPAWMKLARHRSVVLKGLQRIATREAADADD
jgi:transcription elongation factor Elf1